MHSFLKRPRSHKKVLAPLWTHNHTHRAFASRKGPPRTHHYQPKEPHMFGSSSSPCVSSQYIWEMEEEGPGVQAPPRRSDRLQHHAGPREKVHRQKTKTQSENGHQTLINAGILSGKPHRSLRCTPPPPPDPRYCIPYLPRQCIHQHMGPPRKHTQSEDRGGSPA